MQTFHAGDYKTHMNERDIRLLFETSHWSKARVIYENAEAGWKVQLIPNDQTNPTHTLSSKRGGYRIFKTSDSAISRCKDLGFTDIRLEFESIHCNYAAMKAPGKTILLVEDNDDDVELTLRAFEKSELNNQVIVTKDGKEALDYLFGQDKYASRNIKNQPNLILLDINLPKLSGLEVLKKIRENEATRFVPVVMLTTSDETQDVMTGYQLGSNSYIKKPVNFQVFSTVINDLGQYWLQTNTPAPQ